MSCPHISLKILTASLLLSNAACRPDTSPAQEKPAATPAPAAPAPSATANPADTLHLPGGQVVQLHPSTAAVFNQLPASGLPDLPNDPTAEPLAAAQGKVRRQGLDLFLPSAQGGEVKLSSTPDADFTLQNADGVKYMYWGTLPAAHQWAVRAWYWESSGTVLVDQRTGRRLALIGDPVASPDGRLVLLTSPGLGGGEQANLLELAEIDAAGPRLRWRREPTAWEAREARWAAPNRAILKLRHLNAQGEMPDDAPETYAELDISR
ncbi:hypothetical protein Q5H92_00025 [Hymenobacter sp. M29]|uniref:Lipoprotein n=1 Tax=Hymenobacter mellowenesis TaxID=3063995 RepID=A0ABT9A4G9_9BACT|nr:hypothetical protein [Hymenobacter sp. M29]MDO7844724.1 hypothetical protein [Hymenobacter sp. M29]